MENQLYLFIIWEQSRNKSDDIISDIQSKFIIREIFEICIQLKGTISGEHGIGYVQKEYMDIAFSTVTIQLQKNIKNLFDPKGIMNPGKVFI